MADSQANAKQAQKKLKLLGLVLLIFYGVSGGPFGLELIVKAGGPFYALTGFSLLLVWALPEALMTAELATAMPEASGSVAWVTVAFGPFWGFQDGWLSWISGVVDNTLYPVLFIDCLVQLLGGKGSGDDAGVQGVEGDMLWMLTQPQLRMCIILSITAVLTYLTYRGLDIVSDLSVILCLLSLSPFVVFCLVGIWYVEPERWMRGPSLSGGGYGSYKDVNWSMLLNTFFWNINYWESSAVFAGDIENPGKVFPKGLAIAVALVAVSGFFPILVGTGASNSSSNEWTDGYFVRLSAEIVGPWLGYWMIGAAALTNIGMFVAEMSSDAWMVAGMADRGIIPKVIGQRNQFDTPTYGVLLSAGGIICLSYLSFLDIVDMLNLVFCLAQAIEFAAFLYLRIYREDIHRPYKIPLSVPALCFLLILPFGFIGVIIAFSTVGCLILSTSLMLMGVVMFHLTEYLRKNNLCEFEPLNYETVESCTDTAPPVEGELELEPLKPVAPGKSPRHSYGSFRRSTSRSGYSSNGSVDVATSTAAAPPTPATFASAVLKCVNDFVQYTHNLMYDDDDAPSSNGANNPYSAL